MAKTTAPLLSFGASGQIGSAQVYGTWRGVSYARRYTVPANPRTTAQVLTRNIFRSLNSIWLVAPALLRDPWTLAALGRPLTDRNLFTGRNIREMRGESDMQKFVASPGAHGGLPQASSSATPGDGQITVDFVNPDAPTGWTLESAVAIAFQDQEPDDPWSQEIHANEDDTTQNEVVLSGLDNSELYVVAAWLRWSKPNGRPAYGPSLVTTATPTN